MNIEKCNKGEGIKLIQELGLEVRCKYCNILITDETFGSVFTKPSRASCCDIECVKRCLHDTKEKEVDGIIELPKWLENVILSERN